MPLWGANTSDESKPKNLTAEEKSRTFATTRGWEIRRADGTDEVLVAIRNLSGGVTTGTSVKLEAATISQVFFTTASVEADVSSIVRVVWNERITPTTTGTLVVRDLTNSANITATRFGAPGPNYLDYRFRTPVSPAALAVQAQTITQGINDFGSTDITSDVTIASGDVGSVANIQNGTSTLVTTTNAAAQIQFVYFTANSFSTGNTAAAVVVIWDQDVTATTTGTMTVMRSTTTSDVALTATRFGPAAGSSVTFRFTAPATTGVTLSITSQTISMGIINADTTATTADLTIVLSEVIGAAGDGGSTSVVTTA